jgi:hypothetical protein
MMLACIAATTNPTAGAARVVLASAIAVLAATIERRGLYLFVVALLAATSLGMALLGPRAPATSTVKRGKISSRPKLAQRASLAAAIFGALLVACSASALLDELGSLAISMGAVAAGWTLGTHLRTAEAKDAVTLDRGLLAPAVAGVASWVSDMDVWVIDALWNGMANLVRAGSWVNAEIDERVFEAPARGVASRVALVLGVERTQKIAFALVALALLAAGLLFVASAK